MKASKVILFKIISLLKQIGSDLYPLRASELPKVGAMFGLFTLILFNYVVLRTCKDTLIITMADKGAATIPFINIWLVGPFAFLVMFVEIKLFALLQRTHVFYVNVIFLTAIYLLYLLVLFPHLDFFRLQGLTSTMADILTDHPALLERLSPLLTMIDYWPTSLFYVLAETWSTIMLGLLFWGMANDVTKLEEAKRIYAPIGIGGPLAYFTAGHAVDYLIKHLNITHAENMNFVLMEMALVIAIVSCLIMFFYAFTIRLILRERPELTTLLRSSMAKIKEKKPTQNRENLLVAITNPHLRHLAITVIGYGVSINLLEVYWKSQLKIYFPSSVDCLDFIARAQIYNSYIAVILLFITGVLVRRLGWTFTALVTPISFLVTGTLFFALIIFPDLPWQTAFALFGEGFSSALAMAVWMGMIQNVLSKATKNSIYNVVKELAYIPLDPETRIKGKSAIDILAERIGKWGGALLIMIFIFIFGDLSKTVVPTAIALIIMCLLWIYSTLRLGKEMNKKRIDPSLPSV